MTIFGDGTQKRAFSYIGDVAPVIAEAIDVPEAYNQVFNIGTDQPNTVSELALTIARTMGAEPHVVHLPPRNEVLFAYSSHEKVHQVFSPRESVSLEEGLSRMAEWVKQHGVRTSQVFDNIEVKKNFPAAWQT